jgi:apolipoprotein N-acyltransferase
MLSRFTHPIILSFGLRRAAIAFAAGAASTLALAPFSIWPVMFVTMPVLVLLIDGAGRGGGGLRAAAVIGWWFGFGYFLAGLYWVGYAFLVDAKIFGWLLPIAVVGLPAMLAFFLGFGVALARLLWTPGPMRLVALAAALTLADWLRGHIFTGFPWNSFGYALTSPLARWDHPTWLGQSAALVGLWGLTFIAVLVFATPALLADHRRDTRRPWRFVSAAVALLIGLSAYGFIRLERQPTAYVDHVRLRLMQPNLSQDEKFNYGAKQAVLARYLALSARGGDGDQGLRNVTHLIWPESAFPFFLTREPDALAQIAHLLPDHAVLMTGGIRAPETAPPTGPITSAYNSAYVIDSKGSILSVYDKMHLVPFGEYLPFQDTLERLGLMQLTKVHGGFIAGTRRRASVIPGAPRVLPLICYEIIFPGEAVPRGERPGWLLNLTNDGWFGISTGPYQHFQQARVRAIEEGLPLVRAANTGISAVVDPLGRVTAYLPLGREDVLDAALPQAIASTPYVRFRDWPVTITVLLAFLVVTVRRLRQP